MTKHTRQEAKVLRLNKCHGSACPKHPELEGFRWVSGACIACAKVTLRTSRLSDPARTKAQYSKDRLKSMAKPENRTKKNAGDVEYRRHNAEKCAEVIKLWSARNVDKVRAYAIKTKLKNAEVIRLASARYRTENPEKRKVATRNWRKNNPYKVAAAQQKRHAAKLQRTPTWLTQDDFWMMEQAYEISAIRTKMFGFPWHVDHIIPLQGRKVSGLHVPTNLRVITGTENMRKLNSYEVA